MNLTRRGVLAALAASALALSACGDSDDALQGGSGTTDGGTSAAGTITVGSANFPENVLLAEMYAGVLEAAGVTVEKELNIGAREVYIPALQDGSIDLIPEYNGALLTYFAEGDVEATDSESVYRELQEALPEGLTLLEQSEAEDKDTLSVTAETAERYGLETIADLAPVAGDLVVGAGPEFRTRRQGLVGLEEVYGVTFGQFRPLDVGGPLTVGALKDGEVDVANIFSTDSSIETNGFVTLEDPENLFLAENVVPVISSDKVTPEVEEALNGLSAALTTEKLTTELAKVQVDKQPAEQVAQEFLEAEGLL
ncbi:ABC transporter substrate-binding protein [Vallicoccus soli]|uniref:ABC transporter substrate-binding protein n=1 Tax=Vallicoccus soli TaxID=2339232 RepID=A0A3A3YZP2_9ACTN|nr:ABC transporter substrate-binding protein [Vallicoccus soli]RJK96353.1 ABC transporter substrate-binding protein [Vallicoccus soli]